MRRDEKRENERGKVEKETGKKIEEKRREERIG